MVAERTNRGSDLLGVGIYTISEASRLTLVSAQRIRRWLYGYTYKYRGEARHSPAVWHSQVRSIEGRHAVGFLDLIEIKFVNALRNRGASWATIRSAAHNARREYGHDHPFATQKFLIRTDGRNILGYVLADENNRALMDLATNEFAFENIISPSFIKSLDFDDYQAVRWWPMGRNHNVVIDPQRSFGQPIVTDRGVQTSVLADAFNAKQSYSNVANWYLVSEKAVRDAVNFERRLKQKQLAA